MFFLLYVLTSPHLLLEGKLRELHSRHVGDNVAFLTFGAAALAVVLSALIQLGFSVRITRIRRISVDQLRSLFSIRVIRVIRGYSRASCPRNNKLVFGARHPN